jgi:hypothetical protein
MFTKAGAGQYSSNGLDDSEEWGTKCEVYRFIKAILWLPREREKNSCRCCLSDILTGCEQII